MRATANVKALQMSLQNHQAPLIHHSDRGSQYTYQGYIDLLIGNGSKISMGLTAQDNAYAERVNRTIKEEYLSYWKPSNLQQLKSCVARAVENYNKKRSHSSLRYQTPKSVGEGHFYDSLKGRQMMTIFNNENNN